MSDSSYSRSSSLDSPSQEQLERDMNDSSARPLLFRSPPSSSSSDSNTFSQSTQITQFSVGSVTEIRTPTDFSTTSSKSELPGCSPAHQPLISLVSVPEEVKRERPADAKYDTSLYFFMHLEEEPCRKFLYTRCRITILDLIGLQLDESFKFGSLYRIKISDNMKGVNLQNPFRLPGLPMDYCRRTSALIHIHKEHFYVPIVLYDDDFYKTYFKWTLVHAYVYKSLSDEEVLKHLGTYGHIVHFSELPLLSDSISSTTSEDLCIKELEMDLFLPLPQYIQLDEKQFIKIDLPHERCRLSTPSEIETADEVSSLPSS